jgi:predicted DNA-binding transcriptional regulator AlpA
MSITSQTSRPHVGAAPHFAPGERQVLNETQLAQRWGISAKTLQRWRSEGRGPRYLKLSKRVSYPLEVIAAFERDVMHDSTSERVIDAQGGGAR